MSRKDDLEFCRIIGRGFKVEPEPFADWCQQTDMLLPALIERIEDLKGRGWIRRVAVSVRHRGVGFKHNAMVMIRSQQDQLARIGKDIAGMDAVSHCYQRPHPDGYPHTIYVMLHAYTEQEVERVIKAVVERADAKDYEVLRSVREFKKTTFVPSRWEGRE